MKALNAVRCLILSLGNNAWNLLAAAWWAAHQFGMHGELETYLNMYADMACTCAGEIHSTAAMLRDFGMYPTEETLNNYFNTCSEEAA